MLIVRRQRSWRFARLGHSIDYTHLSIHERTHLEFRLSDGWGTPEIAVEMDRSLSTVYRELSRGGGSEQYNAQAAQARYESTRRRNHRLLDADPALAAAIVCEMKDHRSIRQACQLVRRAHPDWTVPCHETVYAWMYASASKLAAMARAAMIRIRRHRRKRKKAGDRRGQIPNMAPIADRPFGPEDRSEFGHWEGDEVVGKLNQSAVVTLVERKTRYTIVVHLPSRRADVVTRMVIRAIKKLPAGAMVSLTWDQGKEMVLHAKITKATGVPVYFADAHSPWQRGTNENTNGVLRRKLPKGTDLSWVKARDAEKLSKWLNRRPMPILSWDTPEDAYERELVALRP
jgi:IS30 family transposase